MNSRWKQSLVVLMAILVLGPAMGTGANASKRRQALIDRLSDDDVATRRIAARAMARQNEATAEMISGLRQGLKDEDATVRSYSAQTLGHFGAASETAIPDLVNLLEDNNRDEEGQPVWVSSSKALGAIGEPALSTLIKLLDDPQGQRYYGAAAAINLMGPAGAEAAPILIRQLESTDGENLWITIRALGELGDAAEPAVPGIIKSLDHENFHIQVAACTALGQLGPKAKAAVPNLITLLHEGIASTRGHAALALGHIGLVEGHDVVAALVEHTGEKRDSVRHRCLEALKTLGPEAAKPALPSLYQLMRNGDYRNRIQATDTVWSLTGDGDEPIRILLSVLEDPDMNLEALAVLEEHGMDSAPAVEGLIPYLKASDPEIRSETAHVLSAIGPSARMAVPELTRVAQEDADLEVRQAAALALQSIQE